MKDSNLIKLISEGKTSGKVLSFGDYIAEKDDPLKLMSWKNKERCDKLSTLGLKWNGSSFSWRLSNDKISVDVPWMDVLTYEDSEWDKLISDLQKFKDDGKMDEGIAKPTNVDSTDNLDTVKKAKMCIPASAHKEGEEITVTDGTHTYKFKWVEGKAESLDENSSPENKRCRDLTALGCKYSSVLLGYRTPVGLSDYKPEGEKLIKLVKMEDIKNMSEEEWTKLMGQVKEEKAKVEEPAMQEGLNEGFGDEAFVKFPDGQDLENYFFKVDSEDGNRAFVLSVGKLCEYEKPTEGKNEFAVLVLNELAEKDMDQAVIDKGKFKSNTKLVVLSDAETSKVLTSIAHCVTDYLENNPDVHKFYDQIPTLLRNHSYDNKFEISLEKWPGGGGNSGGWKMQTAEPEKYNIVTK